MSSPKRPRKKKFTDPKKHTILRLRRELKKVSKKLTKMVGYWTQGRMRTPAKKRIWSEDGKVLMKTIEIPRRQGFSADGAKAERLNTYINRMRANLKEMGAHCA